MDADRIFGGYFLEIFCKTTSQGGLESQLPTL